MFYLRVNVKVHVKYNICTGEYWNPVRREEGNLIILTERVREVFASKGLVSMVIILP